MIYNVGNFKCLPGLDIPVERDRQEIVNYYYNYSYYYCIMAFKLPLLVKINRYNVCEDKKPDFTSYLFKSESCCNITCDKLQ